MQSLEMTTINALRDGLNGSQKRHAAISDNLANVNTPGYKRKEVSFEENLSRLYIDKDVVGRDLKDSGFEMENGRIAARPTLYRVDDTNMRNDDNNVDPDREMAKMTKNQLHYTGMARMMQQQFKFITDLLGQLGRP
ncbi:MAG: flagellar basal body rod protein FlgB [bacterium]